MRTNYQGIFQIFQTFQSLMFHAEGKINVTVPNVYIGRDMKDVNETTEIEKCRISSSKT